MTALLLPARGARLVTIFAVIAACRLVVERVIVRSLASLLLGTGRARRPEGPSRVRERRRPHAMTLGEIVFDSARLLEELRAAVPVPPPLLLEARIA
jgi:hypothetical protein